MGDVGCWGFVMLGVWDVRDVGYWECGMLGDVGCLGCEMLGMCDVWDVVCSGCGIFRM